MYTVSRQEPYMFISPLYVLGVLFLSEVVFHRLPACYQWRENFFAQDRISSYTYQTCNR